MPRRVMPGTGARGAVPASWPVMATDDIRVHGVPDVSPDLPPATWRLMLALLRRMPQGTMSRAFGSLADIPLPAPLRRPVLGAFARAVGADLSETELPLEAYPSLNQFFTRKLTAGARTIPHDRSVAACPVDGAVGQVGEVREGRILQAKGRRYSVADLLDDEAEAGRFDGGSFATLYLSPRDYHRIHAPTDGQIHLAKHVPGALLPVNAAAVAHIPDLFARNERLLCYLDGPLGRIAVVAVGAYNVGRISAAFDPRWNAPPGRSAGVTNLRRMEAATRRYDPAVRMRQGDHLMTFHLGSTVILIFEPGRAARSAALAPGASVRLGDVIARAAGDGKDSSDG
jgi:phosphatidylserine decarboxylase